MPDNDSSDIFTRNHILCWTCEVCGWKQYDADDEEYYVCRECETVFELDHNGDLVIAEDDPEEE
jgi:hypothetical protein